MFCSEVTTDFAYLTKDQELKKKTIKTLTNIYGLGRPTSFAC